MPCPRCSAALPGRGATSCPSYGDGTRTRPPTPSSFHAAAPFRSSRWLRIGWLAAVALAAPISVIAYLKVPAEPSRSTGTPPGSAPGLNPSVIGGAPVDETPAGTVALREAIDTTPIAQELMQRGHEALSLGDFEQALNLFTSSASFDPTDRISRVAIADTLAAWGWDHIDRRRYEEAVIVLRRALDAVGDHASALAGLGYAYGQLRRDDAALATWLRAAEVDPSDGRVHQWLGDLYDRRNDLQNAAASYRRASALKPGDAVLAGRAARLDRERERQSAFVQAATRHFTVQFDGRENRDLHRIAVGILEDAYGEIGRAFRFFPSDATTVILYSHQQFQDITRSPRWTGAIFDGKIRVPSDGYEARLDAFKRVLFHEYTHALIHAKIGVSIARIGERPGPRVPIWLHEGLAQYFERSAGDPAASGEPVFPGSAGESLLLPLAALEGSFLTLGDADASVAYAQSRSMVRYLIERYGMDRMNRLLDRLASNQPFDAACRDTFSAPYERLERAWRETVLADGP